MVISYFGECVIVKKIIWVEPFLIFFLNAGQRDLQWAKHMVPNDSPYFMSTTKHFHKPLLIVTVKVEPQ